MEQESSPHDAARNQGVAPAAEANFGRQDWVPERWWHRLLQVLAYGNGQTISRYKISEKVADGGIGVVYKAQDPKLEGPVALRVLSSGLFATDEQRLDFLRRAQATTSVTHPHLCRVHRVEEVRGDILLVTDYLEGQTLAQIIERGSLPMKDVLSAALSMVQALREVHKNGILHLNLNPANVILGTDGEYVVQGLGLAGISKNCSPYRSPEELRGEVVDQRSDIWSLGVMLYEMAAGRFPLAQGPEPIHELMDAAPTDTTSLNAVVAKALARSPHQRYRHLEEFEADLGQEKFPYMKTSIGLVFWEDSLARIESNLLRDHLREANPESERLYKNKLGFSHRFTQQKKVLLPQLEGLLRVEIPDFEAFRDALSARLADPLQERFGNEDLKRAIIAAGDDCDRVAVLLNGEFMLDGLFPEDQIRVRTIDPECFDRVLRELATMYTREFDGSHPFDDMVVEPFEETVRELRESLSTGEYTLNAFSSLKGYFREDYNERRYKLDGLLRGLVRAQNHRMHGKYGKGPSYRPPMFIGSYQPTNRPELGIVTQIVT